MSFFLAQNNKRGFTIVELVIVIVVIGILASLAIVAYDGVQRSARDKSVLSDIDAVAGLETRYALKNNVPGKVWSSASGVDPDLKFTPSPGNVIEVAINATDYCIRGYNPASTMNSPLNSASKGSTTDACTTIPSGYLAIPGGLNAASTINTQLSLSWSAASGATSYSAQCAQDSGFTSGVLNSSVSSPTVSTTFSGLTPATTYYCRVKSVIDSTVSVWSDTVSQATMSVSPPTSLSAVAASSTQIDLSWSSVATATGYTVQRSTSPSFSSPTSVGPQAGTTLSVTALTPGVQYYFRVLANKNAEVSGWSPTAGAVTTMSGVSGLAASVVDTDKVALSWSVNAAAASYEIQTSTSSDFTSGVSTSTSSTNSKSLTALTIGTAYYYRVRAIGASGTSGSWSNTATATTYTNVLYAGNSLYSNPSSGISLMSDNNQYRMILQPDGNLVVYRISDGVPVWNKGGTGNSTYRITMQPDGNLVVYSDPGTTVQWQTFTDNRAFLASGSTSWYLQLGDDGNLMVADGYKVTWSWMTGKIAPPCTEIQNDNFRIMARHSGKALDVTSASQSDGQQLQQYDYGGGNNQRFTVTSLGGGQYKMIAIHSGKAVDMDANNAGSNGAKIQQWGYSGGNNQRWTFAQTSSGYCRLINVQSGKVMEVSGGPSATGNSALIQQWDWLSATNQEWIFNTP